MAEETGTPASRIVSAEPAERPERFPGEQALKDLALEATAEGISIADLRQPDAPLIYVNQGFENLTGYPAREALGRNCRFLQGPETDSETRAAISKAIRDRREIVAEVLNYRKDGRPFWNRLSLTPVRTSGGEVTHYIGVQSDVTERREAETRLRVANDELRVAAAHTRRGLEAAARVQRSLLPEMLPAVKGASFAWLFTPSEQLAGDLPGIVQLDDHEVGLYVIDVAGHGVAAALLSVTLCHWLEPTRGRSPLVTADPREGKLVSVPPALVASRLSGAFPFDTRTALYFTMLYGVLDIAARSFRFACAAHPAPIVLPAGGDPFTVPCSGLPIGIVPGAVWDEVRVDLRPGDRLFIYSDGVTEAENSSEQEFRVERLQQEIAAARREPLDEALHAIVGAVKKWSGTGGHRDDITIVAFELDPVGAPRVGATGARALQV